MSGMAFASKWGLHRGDRAHWAAPWGRSPASVEDNGTTLLMHVGTDPEQISAGLFYGSEGMRGGRQAQSCKLRLASHIQSNAFRAFSCRRPARSSVIEILEAKIFQG